MSEQEQFLTLLTLQQMRQKLAEVDTASQGTPWYLFVDPTTITPLGQVQFQTEPDGKVCPICGEYDGDYYDFLDDSKPFPPLHPNCRCYYIYVPTGQIVDFSEFSDWT